MTKTMGDKRTPKPSQYIARKQAQTLFRAVDFSIWNQEPLNLYVVINFIDSASSYPVTTFGKVRHKFRDWLKHKDITEGRLTGRPTYIYTFENPREIIHVNWMVRVNPLHLAEFRKKLPQWLDKAQGRHDSFDIHVAPIEPGTEKTLANYLMKAVSPSVAPHFFLEEICEYQGEIWGQRAGASMNISKAARLIDGFTKTPRVRFETPDGPRSRALLRVLT
jgi:hypothetical protein